MSSIRIGALNRFQPQPEFAIGETLIPASSQVLQPHRHSSAQLHLILDGAYVESSREKQFRLGPGSALFRPAYEVHSNRFCNAAVHGVLVDFEQSRAAQLLPGMDVSSPHYFPADTFDDVCRAFRMESGQDRSERHLAYHALVLTLATRISRQARSRSTSKMPAWMCEAAALIHSRYAEDLRLSALSSEVGVTPARLTAGFRRYLRQSVGSFLTQVRLQEARRAIVDTDRPLSQVATSCGFYDQAHLTRTFRRCYGTTPGELRRVH